jgi:hypothetical protein
LTAFPHGASVSSSFFSMGACKMWIDFVILNNEQCNEPDGINHISTLQHFQYSNE